MTQQNISNVGKYKLLKTLLTICISAAIVTIIYALSFGLYDLAYFNLGMLSVGIVSSILYKLQKLEYSYQLVLIVYIIFFTSSVWTDAVYQSAVLVYVATSILPTFFTDDKRIQIFYLVASIVCGMIFIYFFPEKIDRVEPYRWLIELVTLFGITSLLFKMGVESRKLIEENRKLLLKSEKKLLEQYALVSEKNHSLNQVNKELQKYINSNIQLEQFAHIASHDLKAPLRTISSYTGLLKRSLYKDSSDKNKLFFDFVEAGVIQMFNLISDLLNYSKANSQAMQITSCDLNQIAGEVLRELAFDIRSKNAIIILHHLPEKIRIDNIKIKQVLQNIISNSLKFTRSDGIPEIVLESTEKEGKHIISICDNGIGIQEEYHDSIFEPFVQLNSGSTYSGTGIGLSICKKVINHHGGDIWIDKTYTDGTRILFSIPKEINRII